MGDDRLLLTCEKNPTAARSRHILLPAPIVRVLFIRGEVWPNWEYFSTRGPNRLCAHSFLAV
jgi:hypothetical protein